MWVMLPLPFLVLSFVLLIRAEEHDPREEKQVWVWKPLTTLLVILTCLLSLTRTGAHDPVYTLLIAGGLLLSLAGDVLLIPQNNNRAFVAGLVAFLLAHVAYIGAMVYLQATLGLPRNRGGEVFAGILLALLGGVVYAYLKPGLGAMRRPVLAYVIVISVMVHRAAAVALAYGEPSIQPALLVIGATLFYLSDAILAVNKFRLGGQMPHYRLWNLSTYYTGQLFLALSAAFLG